jgi:hypothetical protein
MLGRRCLGLRATSAAADVRVARALGFLPMLLEHIEKGEIDPSSRSPIALRLNRDRNYQTFRDKKDGCIKLVKKP